MLVSMVDVIFADVAQPDQARIVGLVRIMLYHTYDLGSADIFRMLIYISKSMEESLSV